MTIRVYVMTAKFRQFEVDLPAKRIVCPTCDGRGTHVNPNIDGNGIDPCEFDEDPDFKEAYFRGDYDVRCEDCLGRNVITVVDEKRLTPKMRDRYWRQLEEEASHRREMAAERRMGA